MIEKIQQFANENTRENDEHFLWLDSILNARDEDLTQTERDFKTKFLN